MVWRHRECSLPVKPLAVHTLDKATRIGPRPEPEPVASMSDQAPRVSGGLQRSLPQQVNYSHFHLKYIIDPGQQVALQSVDNER